MKRPASWRPTGWMAVNERRKRRSAPVGSVVRITYDSDWYPVCPGDALVSGTGRVYVVDRARQQLTGKHAGRWHLACVVAEAVPEGARVHVLRWYPRLRDRAGSKPRWVHQLDERGQHP